MTVRRDPERVLEECEEQRFRSSGPGGQHKNKVETAVRLLHRPTGLSAQSTRHRSLAQNRAAALERLLERLLVLDTPVKQRRDSRPTRGSVRRRLEGKRRRSETKSGRRRQDDC